MTFDPDYILSQLSLKEKISLTAAYDFWHTSPIERLNVPSIRCSDGPNGLRGTRFFNPVPSAVFPCGTSLAATFNKKLLRSAGELMAIEAKAKNIHIILGPTINLLRSPLYGRGFEAFGEDPYLSGLVASEIIKGVQSLNILATVKHFVCNEIEDKRFGSNSILTERALREVYLKPFEIAIKNSNPGLVMTSYNKINNIHCSNSKKLITNILRKEWGFDGLVISDWGGTYSIKESYMAGLDLEFPGPPRFRNPELVLSLIESMELNEKLIDEIALRTLKTISKCLKSNIPSNGEETTYNNNENTKLKLREIGSNGIVLLKNDKNLLPLSKNDDIAIIGPNAFISTYCGGGSASLRPYYTTNIFDSVSNKLSYTPESTIGCYSFKKSPEMNLFQDPELALTGFELNFFDKPTNDPSRTKLESCILDSTHIFFYKYGIEKYPELDYCIDMKGYWKCEESGDYNFGLSVIGSAKLYIDSNLILENKTTKEDVVGIFTQDFHEKHNIIRLEKNKIYQITVEFSSPKLLDFKLSNDCGAGTINFGVSRAFNYLDEIKNAQKIAARHNKVILCIGLNKEWESEGFDRKNMELPGHTNELVESILKVNPNCIIINQSGTPVEFPWLENSSTLLQAWFGGNELGNSIADILFGDVSPSGKLPMTFPYKCKDNPTYLTYKSDGGNIIYGEDIFVGYKYYEAVDKKVAFPFGFGLSYTKFLISNLKIEYDLQDNDLIKIFVDVSNCGTREGSEVIQVYTSFEGVSDFLKPVKQFRNFDKITLRPNEKVTSSINLSKKDITSIWNSEKDQWQSIPGSYKILVGNSSDNLKSCEIINLEFETYYWL